jgi:prepilin-type N-terminal cleavage/methylation domain-containing protein
MRQPKGFTIIEIIIVITIIGILSGAMLLVIFGAPSKARDNIKISHLRQIMSIIVTMEAEKGDLPTEDGCIDKDFFGDYVKVRSYKDPSYHENDPPLHYSGQKECDGYYWYEANPGDNFDSKFSVAAIMENWSMANTICPPALDDGILVHQKKAPPGQHYCHVLVEETTSPDDLEES